MGKFIFAPLLFFALTVSTGLHAQNNKQINFLENNWTGALKLAAAQNKYVFVDAYTTWCGPCKMMRATSFKDNKAAAFFNQNFINVAIDLEKGVGPQLASQWQIRSVPTLIVFDAKGKPVLGSEGYINAKDLLRFGEQAISKKKP